MKEHNYWFIVANRTTKDGGFLALTKLQQLAYLKLMFAYYDGELKKRVSLNSKFNFNAYLAKILDCNKQFIISLKDVLLREELIDEDWTPLLNSELNKNNKVLKDECDPQFSDPIRKKGRPALNGEKPLTQAERNKKYREKKKSNDYENKTDDYENKTDDYENKLNDYENKLNDYENDYKNSQNLENLKDDCSPCVSSDVTDDYENAPYNNNNNNKNNNKKTKTCPVDLENFAENKTQEKITDEKNLTNENENLITDENLPLNKKNLSPADFDLENLKNENENLPVPSTAPKIKNPHMRDKSVIMKKYVQKKHEKREQPINQNHAANPNASNAPKTTQPNQTEAINACLNQTDAPNAANMPAENTNAPNVGAKNAAEEVTIEFIRKTYNQTLTKSGFKIKHCFNPDEQTQVKELLTNFKECQNPQFWQDFFNYIKNNDFLCGKIKTERSPNGFKPKLKWLLDIKNIEKVINNDYTPFLPIN